jgi:hypothetical protein
VVQRVRALLVRIEIERRASAAGDVNRVICIEIDVLAGIMGGFS